MKERSTDSNLIDLPNECNDHSRNYSYEFDAYDGCIKLQVIYWVELNISAGNHSTLEQSRVLTVVAFKFDNYA